MYAYFKKYLVNISVQINKTEIYKFYNLLWSK